MEQLSAFLSDSDNNNQDLKDTCIGGSEIPFQHKCPMQNCQMGHRTLFSILNLEVSSNISVPKAEQTSRYKSRAISKGRMQMSKTNLHNHDSVMPSISEKPGVDKSIEVNTDHDQLLIKQENASRIEEGMLKSSFFLMQSSRSGQQVDQATPTSPSSSKSSFAFPTLESEWYGSPTRIGEADRREIPKRQRFKWGTYFRCCKS